MSLVGIRLDSECDFTPPTILLGLLLCPWTWGIFLVRSNILQKPYSQKSSQSNHTRTTALSNSRKLSHACGATQDRWVMVERSDRLWSTGEGNGKPLYYSCLENPMNSMKRQNDKILKEVLPRLAGAQYATGGQWRNNSRKNEEMEPKQNQYPVVDVIGDRSKV